MNRLNRRDFIKLTGMAGAAAMMDRSVLGEVESSQPRSRPNILVFLTDDHARWAQHVNGNSEIRTPTLDNLAATGTRMNNAFTTCPVCSPSRASFFTGVMPSQHGIHDWIQGGQYDAAPRLDGQILLSQLLKSTGYYTGLIGKWHCGHDWKPQPGFDRWFSYWTDRHPHLGRQNFSDNGQHIVREGRQAPMLTEQAIAFLNNHAKGVAEKDSPFFLYISYEDTHFPHIDAPPDLVDSYQDAKFTDFPQEPFAPCHGKALQFPDPDPAKAHANCVQYYAAATNVDREVGKVLAALKETGAMDNTLIVYTSDHGLNCGQHGIVEKGASTLPQNFFDESIRVNCTVSWPQGGVGQNAVCDDFVNHCDLWATLLEIAGATPDAKLAAQINSPGRSYLGQLRGSHSNVARDWVVSEYGNARMLRTRQYKLILRYPYKGICFPNELYDMQADPRETKNLYTQATMQKIVTELTQHLDDYFHQYEVPQCSGLRLESLPQFNVGSIWIYATKVAATEPSHG